MPINCPECETLADIIKDDEYTPTCIIQNKKRVIVLEPCGIGWRASSNGRVSLGCSPGEAVNLLLEVTN